MRKRPAPTSTNAPIVRPVFGDEATKLLYIPESIDDYNHHMNGVDLANQLRKTLTCHRPFERRNWRPLWNWLLDLCRVNSYCLSHKDARHKRRGQRQFGNEITEALLNWERPAAPPPPSPPPPPPLSSGRHVWENFEDGKKTCERCKQLNQAQKTLPKALLAPVDNNIRDRPSQTRGGCSTCKMWLCRRTCFLIHHGET